MKRLFTLSLATITLLLSACAYTAKASDVPPNTETKEAEDFTSQPTSNISTQPTESNTETIVVATAETPEEGIGQATKPVPKNTEIAAKITTAIEKKTEDSTTATEAVVNISATDPEPITPEAPIVIKATASDSIEIANESLHISTSIEVRKAANMQQYCWDLRNTPNIAAGS